jgi:hypothetical protein
MNFLCRLGKYKYFMDNPEPWRRSVDQLVGCLVRWLVSLLVSYSVSQKTRQYGKLEAQ